MARQRPDGRNTNREASAARYVKLERRLVLLAWLNSLFGYASNAELLADMKQSDEGFDASGRSLIYYRLAGRGTKVRVPLERLVEYDDNIHQHLVGINRRRIEPITLRYFQHLALLFTEIYLDWRFNRPGELLRELNEFVSRLNAEKPYGDTPESLFTEDDLDKLAFWMATGSGKTLIMHINYRQFLHYNRKPLDNILLITPNERLTDQHLSEMAASGIPCDRFSLDESGLALSDRNAVRVIEISKLVEEKRGGGVSVPVEAFEGNNLVFVDEGHKGSGGEAWRKFRDALGQRGFTFEYSATFGQALTAARNDALTAEYGKAIAFDYSYRYFYGDGYGKDFSILNLRQETTEEDTEVLLLANLLSFYEQQRFHEEHGDLLRPYSLEKPLWVFVGSSVNAVYRESGRPRSDVLTVTRFIHHFLENRRAWATEAIQMIIDGKTGLIDDSGADWFAGRFEYLRARGFEAEPTYGDILRLVFHAPTGGSLHLCDLRGKDGELGLKTSETGQYFGLIYIGDTGAFKKLVEEDGSGIQMEDDVISGSLFQTIGEPDTSVNILIGAKKFMEGWNSWRVSNMGLLNIGRSEGSEIIQLFGRGVRLKGLGMSLKRSSATNGQHPLRIRLLETLNIFAVRANYMPLFLGYLEREGVETEGCVEIPLAIKPNGAFLEKGLLVPRLPPGRRFADDCAVFLQPDEAAKVSVDVSLRVESLRGVAGNLTTAVAQLGRRTAIPDESLELVNWEGLYLDLLDFKGQKGFTNLVIPQDVPRKVLASREPQVYEVVADESVVRPRSFSGRSLLQETAVAILRAYVEKYYRVCQERWDSQNMAYGVLDESDGNFRDYVVRIPRSEAQLIAAVQGLIREGKQIYEVETNDLPNIHFDRHLYQPLLVQHSDKVKSDPPGLNESESRFVQDLKAYVRQEARSALADKEVFLLRNLSRGRGIGFFEKECFFPDFILWVKHGNKQRIVFVEPHGMRMERAYLESDKTRLHERLREISRMWGKAVGLDDVTLDSFIISATAYNDLRAYYADGSWTRDDFAKRHILFFGSPGDASYCGYLFRG